MNIISKYKVYKKRSPTFIVYNFENAIDFIKYSCFEGCFFLSIFSATSNWQFRFY